jgi:D-alanyl-D-alanine dipeptidase
MKTVFFFILSGLYLSLNAQQPPKYFVYLSDIENTIKSDLRYFTHQNFIGKPIDGYKKDTLILTKKAAKALHKIQQILLKENLSLKIFDAYRPQRAVDHFVGWATVLNDTLMKAEYYPEVPKSELFNLGYIASKSGHSRGSTVDITLVDIKTGKELDMGSTYDFFGEISHPFYKKINKKQQKNRLFLRETMLKNGFKPYANEWWHFTLKKEPFPTTYFNFPIE